MLAQGDIDFNLGPVLHNYAWSLYLGVLMLKKEGLTLRLCRCCSMDHRLGRLTLFG